MSGRSVWDLQGEQLCLHNHVNGNYFGDMSNFSREKRSHSVLPSHYYRVNFTENKWRLELWSWSWSELSVLSWNWGLSEFTSSMHNFVYRVSKVRREGRWFNWNLTALRIEVWWIVRRFYLFTQSVGSRVNVWKPSLFTQVRQQARFLHWHSSSFQLVHVNKTRHFGV